MSDLPSPEQPKAFPVPADDGRGFDDKDAGLPVVPDCAQPSPQQSIGRSQFRSLDGALQNAELMAECEDLELQRRPAPEGVVGTQEKLNVSIQPGGEKNGAVFVALLSW